MRDTTPAREFSRVGAAALAVVAVAVSSVSPLAMLAAEPTAVAAPPAVAPEFFADRIRPLLERRCLECHGEDTAEAELRLDSLAGLSKGGRSGPVLVSGDADGSLLVQAVRRLDESLAMPPEQPLDTQEIAALVEWITGGAPHPDGRISPVAPASPVERGRDLWSLVAPVRPPVPPVSAAHGGAEVHPLDAFILADLAARGIEPNPPADKPTLIRRATFTLTGLPPTPDEIDAFVADDSLDAFILADLADRGIEPNPPADKPTLIRRATFTLTGLPPTPDEIDAFVADDSPDAFARVVDRLLASPHYGEHWARHWLDLVRYADSNGLDENVAHGNAWRYRDWVIGALNADMPFDRFAREQLAGDLLAAGVDEPARRIDLLAATGFLSLGPKALAEGDQVKLVMDLIDEQIDTTGRAFFGLSLGCARCHDHKFDPVSQRDYYALAGIFKSTRTMQSLDRIATWHEHVIAPEDDQDRYREHEARIKVGKQAIEDFLTETRRHVAARAGAGPQAFDPELPEEEFPEEARTTLAAMREAQKKLEADLPALDGVMGVADGTPEESRIHVRGSHLMLGQVVARGVPEVLQLGGPLGIPAQASGRRELADWVVDPRHPLTGRVLVNRLWRWHFGRGIVRTTDNFGVMGERPTNQPLLDWLAAELVDAGWSLKAMHRLILSSQAWQRSSGVAGPAAAAAAEADPDNTLWWRADVRRLEAESIRDAMLAVAGRLDRTMGGSLLGVKNRDYVFDHTSQYSITYDTPRRSVYLPVVRNHIADALWLFDCTDGTVGSGDRPTSTVASQALYLLNGDFVIQTAETIATSVVAAAPHDAEARTLLLFRRLFGRRPTGTEIGAARRAMRAFTAALADTGTAPAEVETAAWTALCQTLLVGNEFVLLR